MSKIAERIAKFTGGSAPTPENQTQKMKDEVLQQRVAIQVARARAARYNMTLRSLALKNAQDNKKLQEVERAKLMEAKQKAAKYNATQRALQINRPTKKADIDNLKTIMSRDVTPAIAQEAMEAVAISQMTGEELVQQEIDNAAKAAKEKEPEKEPEQEQEPEQEKEDEKEEVKKSIEETEGFEFKELEGALADGNAGTINKAILTEFLEIHAPHEIENLDSMLVTYDGQQHELFDFYVQKYPSPMDATEEGIIKADDEVFGKTDKEAEETSEDAKKNGELPIEIANLTEEDELIKIDDSDDEEIADEDIKIAVKFDQDKKSAYDERMAAAEEGGSSLARNSLAYEKRLANDAKLGGVVDKYAEEFKKARDSVAALNMPTNEEGYILNAKLEMPSDDEDGIGPGGAAGAWSVQVKSPAQVLKEKLVQQGLSREKAAELAKTMDEEENISEMM